MNENEVLFIPQASAEKQTSHQKQIALKYVSKRAWKYRNTVLGQAGSLMNIDDHHST
jgi:hypothetical protein